MRIHYSVMAVAASVLLTGCNTANEELKPADSSPTELSRRAITDYAQLLMIDGKPNEAFAKYYATDLIQHDPWIADGHDGDDAFLEERREANPDEYDATDQYANVIHSIMADGDLVAIKSHVFTSATDQGRVFVDIWRMEDGKFAEHWDVIQPIEAERANNGSVGCGIGATYDAAKAHMNNASSPACGAPDSSANSEASRKFILEYLTMGQEPGRLIEAIETHVAEGFIQHSARITPGRQGLIDYMVERAEERQADKRTSDIVRVLADGDLVLVHRRVTRDSNPRGTAYVDLFRVRGGEVTDHWDIVQPIPEFSVSGRSMVDGPLEPDRRIGGPDDSQ